MRKLWTKQRSRSENGYKCQEPYSQQRGVRHQFRRNRVITTGIDDQWKADLADISKYAKDNDGYKFILAVIDDFSKYLWLRPLQNKTSAAVVESFKDFSQEGSKPILIHTDKEQEFRAQPAEALFKQMDIIHLLTQNEVKANIVERVIKTICSKIQYYITYK